MATEQVFDWIKNGLQLSRTVNNFEADFSNGYLFAEILNSYGPLVDLTTFSKKNNKEAKVKNFYKVEEALRALKIKFDGKQIHNIMNEERGASLRLLYQMKLALERMQGPPPDQAEVMTTTGLKQATVNRRMEARMEHTMKNSGSVTYATVGGKDIRTNKQKLEDRTLAKYQVTMMKQFSEAQQADYDEKNLVHSLQQQQRSDNRMKLHENQHFLKEWEKEGRQNWKKNQVARAKAIEKVQYFEDREVDLYKQKLNRELNQATNELQGGVSEFEKNLQKLGIEQNINMDDAIKRMEEKKGIPPGQIQNFSYAATMNKIKETKKNADFAGKERERRRRKLMVDQATTQEKLELDRNEELLIQRLLAQQQTEQKQAYIDLHTQQARTMVFDNRRQMALQKEEKQKVTAIELERQRVADAQAGEPQRRKDIERQRVVNQGTRREDKSKVRSLNIEIASEIADLLLDVAEETFQSQVTGAQKVTKQEWRSFMDLFKSGKKVSLRNLKKKPTQDKSSARDDVNEKKITFKQNQRVQELMKEFGSHPALEDFYQYLSSCGKFNLSQISKLEWAEFRELLPEDNKVMDSSMQSNPGFTNFIQSTFAKVKAEKKKKGVFAGSQDFEPIPEEGTVEIEQTERSDIRLCIVGRTFAGKKTLAKQIQTALAGGSNLKLFQMDDVVKEALDYVNPRKNEEAVDPKAKGKPAAKGKAEEEKSLDVFEGKDTDQYKEVAMAIRSQFFGGDEEQINVASRENLLVSRVLDDALLVELFVRRLELQFGEGKTPEQIDQEIREGVVREQELVQQLETIEKEGAGAAPTDKKAAKAPAKGGKAPEEAIKEELEQIRSVNVEGWILLDFPKSLNQMKLLEHHLSGYESKVDAHKDDDFELLEAQSKVILNFGDGTETPPTIKPTQASPSGIDGMVFLDVPEEECLRRHGGRKVDPQTGTIYHMDDNPPPEDPKLRDRLQDVQEGEGDVTEQKIRESSARYDTCSGALKTWCSNFGQYKPNESECAVKLNMVVDQSSATNAGIEEAAMAQVQTIVTFKQSLYDAKRQVMLTKVLAEQEIERQEEERKAAEEEQVDVASKEGSQSKTKTSPKPSEKELMNQTGAGSSKAMLTERQKMENTAQVTEPRPASDFGMLSSQHGDTAFSRDRSQMKSSLQMQRVYEITDFDKAKRWPRMLATYYQNGMQEFNLLRFQRGQIFRNLNETQNKYIEYLMRPSSQQETINEFCESYNRFSTEFPELRGNPSTRDELLNRVDILSHNLWKVIMQRKEESMKERDRLMEGGWVSFEMSNLCNYICTLIENEFLRFSGVVSFVTSYVINEDVDAIGLCNRLSERNVSHLKIDASTGSPSSPLLDQVSSQVITVVDSFLAEAQGMVQLDEAQNSWLLTEQRNFNYRLNQLKTHALLLLQEMQIHANEVFDVLDDWVVIAVEAENEGVQDVVRSIRAAVKINSGYIESFIIAEADLFAKIETIDFQEGPPLYFQEVSAPAKIDDQRFSVAQLTGLFNDFRQNAAFDNVLDSQTFLSVIVASMQSGGVPSAWTYQPFENFGVLVKKFRTTPLSDEADGYKDNQEILFAGSPSANEKRQFVDWKHALVAFALLHSSVPTQQQINDYVTAIKNALPLNGSSELITQEQFINIRAWFDHSEGSHDLPENSLATDAVESDDDDSDDEHNLDWERIRQIKTLLYNTLRQTNEAGLKVQTLEAVLGCLSSSTNTGSNSEQPTTFGAAIFTM